jgi:hypothetical protein
VALPPVAFSTRTTARPCPPLLFVVPLHPALGHSDYYPPSIDVPRTAILPSPVTQVTE